MKFFRSLWVLMDMDNDTMDVALIGTSKQEEPAPQAIFIQQPAQAKYDYSNIINLLDYMKHKKEAYQG